MATLKDILGEVYREDMTLAEIEKALVDKEFFEKKLNNAGFVAKAPAQLIEQQKESLNKVLEKIKMLEDSIKEIGEMA